MAISVFGQSPFPRGVGHAGGGGRIAQKKPYLFGHFPRIAEKHDFLIFADECYAEIWRDAPPVGILQVAAEVAPAAAAPAAAPEATP